MADIVGEFLKDPLGTVGRGLQGAASTIGNTVTSFIPPAPTMGPNGSTTIIKKRSDEMSMPISGSGGSFIPKPPLFVPSVIPIMQPSPVIAQTNGPDYTAKTIGTNNNPINIQKSTPPIMQIIPSPTSPTNIFIPPAVAHTTTPYENMQQQNDNFKLTVGNTDWNKVNPKNIDPMNLPYVNPSSNQNLGSTTQKVNPSAIRTPIDDVKREFAPLTSTPIPALSIIKSMITPSEYNPNQTQWDRQNEAIARLTTKNFMPTDEWLNKNTGGPTAGFTKGFVKQFRDRPLDVGIDVGSAIVLSSLSGGTAAPVLASEGGATKIATTGLRSLTPTIAKWAPAGMLSLYGAGEGSNILNKPTTEGKIEAAGGASARFLTAFGPDVLPGAWRAATSTSTSSTLKNDILLQRTLLKESGLLDPNILQNREAYGIMGKNPLTGKWELVSASMGDQGSVSVDIMKSDIADVVRRGYTELTDYHPHINGPVIPSEYTPGSGGDVASQLGLDAAAHELGVKNFNHAIYNLEGDIIHYKFPDPLKTAPNSIFDNIISSHNKMMDVEPEVNFFYGNPQNYPRADVDVAVQAAGKKIDTSRMNRFNPWANQQGISTTRILPDTSPDMKNTAIRDLKNIYDDVINKVSNFRKPASTYIQPEISQSQISKFFSHPGYVDTNLPFGRTYSAIDESFDRGVLTHPSALNDVTSGNSLISQKPKSVQLTVDEINSKVPDVLKILNTQKPIATLTQDQFANRVRDYVFVSHSNANAVLRGDKSFISPGEIEDITHGKNVARTLFIGMDHFGDDIPAGTILYRGLPRGDPLLDPSLQSWSKSPNIATHFAGPQGTVLKYTTKSTIKGIDVDKYSHDLVYPIDATEKEIILKPQIFTPIKSSTIQSEKLIPEFAIDDYNMYNINNIKFLELQGLRKSKKSTPSIKRKPVKAPTKLHIKSLKTKLNLKTKTQKPIISLNKPTMNIINTIIKPIKISTKIKEIDIKTSKKEKNIKKSDIKFNFNLGEISIKTPKIDILGFEKLFKKKK